MPGFELGDSMDAADDWVAAWSATVNERAAQAHDLSQRVARLSAVASGSRGAVEVTVTGSGTVSDIQLDDRVLDWRPAEIAREILTVMRRAQADLARLVADAAAETVGTDSDTGRAVVNSFAERFPAPPDPEDSEDSDEPDRHERGGRRGGW